MMPGSFPEEGLVAPNRDTVLLYFSHSPWIGRNAREKVRKAYEESPTPRSSFQFSGVVVGLKQRRSVQTE